MSDKIISDSLDGFKGFDVFKYLFRAGVIMNIIESYLKDPVSTDALESYKNTLKNYTEQDIENMLDTVKDKDLQLRPHFFKLAIIKLITIKFPALAK